MFGAKKEVLSAGSKYLVPGVQNATVVSLDIEELNEKRVLMLKLKAQGEPNESATLFRMYTTDKAINYTMNQLYEIIRAIDPTAESVDAESFEDYIAKVKPFIIGKSYIQKLIGRQGSDGKYYTNMPLSSRNEKNKDATIACAIGTEPTFTYDQSNPYDYVANKDLAGAGATQAEAPKWG